MNPYRRWGHGSHRGVEDSGQFLVRPDFLLAGSRALMWNFCFAEPFYVRGVPRSPIGDAVNVQTASENSHGEESFGMGHGQIEEPGESVQASSQMGRLILFRENSDLINVPVPWRDCKIDDQERDTGPTISHFVCRP